MLPVVLETIRPESFFNEQHKELFQIIFQMFTSGEKADVITVLNAAVERKVFETAAEGRNYLAALVNIVPSVSNIERYCEVVAEKYYIRCLAYAARGILQDIQSGEESAQTLMDAAEQRIFDIRQGEMCRGWRRSGTPSVRRMTASVKLPDRTRKSIWAQRLDSPIWTPLPPV